MRTDEDKKTRLGVMGENCVSNYLSLLGRRIIRSIDPYDSSKDMIVDGKRVEVKTQVPFINELSFTISQNQLTKCRAVDELYFVALPSPHSRFQYAGQSCIYLADPQQFEFKRTVTRDGRTKILIPIEQPAITKICEIDQEDVKLMMQYSSSI